MTLPFPKQANFLITPKCNANCYFCLNDWREESYDIADELTLEEKKQSLTDLQKSGVNFLVITGGEPTLDEDLEAILAHGHSLGIDMVMQTHGMFLNEEKIANISPYLLGLQVSIEGMEKAHNEVTRGGNFERSIQGIKNAVHAGMIVQVNTTMTKFNEQDMKNFVPFIHSLGVSRLNLIRLYFAGNAMKYHNKLFLSKENIQKMIDEAGTAAKLCGLDVQLQGSPIKELFSNAKGISGSSGCGAGTSEITLNYNGEISPCPSWNRSFGNISSHNLQEVWNSTLMNTVRQKNFGTNCSSCPLSLTKNGDEYESKTLSERIDVRKFVGGSPIFTKKSQEKIKM